MIKYNITYKYSDESMNTIKHKQGHLDAILISIFKFEDVNFATSVKYREICLNMYEYRPPPAHHTPIITINVSFSVYTYLN